MLPRTLEPRLRTLAASFPAVFLTGPRQSGKTTLARATFPDFHYVSLEDLQNRQEAVEDPRGFLRRLEGKSGVILDEVQRTPDLFSYLQGFLDDVRSGPMVLTGSQNFLMSERISQSLAGRVAILELLPLSVAELAGRPALLPEELTDPVSLREEKPPRSLEELLFQGLYPRIHDRQLDASIWLDGYLRTYIERDVRQLSNIGNLEAFSRFLALCAGRSGQLLNSSALAVEAGVSHPTARSWISVLQASYIVLLLKPHHENFNKRLVKSPKLYFLDSGLLCHVLGLRRPEDLLVHPLRGAIFETFVISELYKLFLHHGQPSPLYFWRDSAGHEVDALLDLGTKRIPVEVKAGRTLAGDVFRGLDYYLGLSGGGPGVLIYGGEESYVRRDHVIRSWWQCG
ncbi:MAG TPA: ATP-binding protein [Thermoanaerobaculia bacterium]